MNNKLIIEEFSFGNFRSFKDLQSLNMTAAKLKSKNSSLDKDNIYNEENKKEILKSKIIYGANASGKSNIITALKCFITIITDCLQNKQVLLDINPFYFSTETDKQPSFFQLIFRSEGIRYRYGFEADRRKIHSEWLYLVPKTREVCIFEREELQISNINVSRFTTGAEIANLKNKLFYEPTLFLRVADSFGDSLARKIVELISSISILDESTSLNFIGNEIANRLENEEDRKLIVNLIKIADVGINDLTLLKLPVEGGDKDKSILSVHSRYDSDNNLLTAKEVYRFSHLESEGTKLLLQLTPKLIDALKEGKPIFIDEFGSKLHPLLTRKIISLFHTSNTSSQLIAVTHNVDLFNIDSFRRDQIDLVEKDKYGASHLYTLLELKGIRKEAVVNKEYLQGRYGAIPVLGNWENCLNLLEDGEENECN